MWLGGLRISCRPWRPFTQHMQSLNRPLTDECDGSEHSCLCSGQTCIDKHNHFCWTRASTMLQASFLEDDPAVRPLFDAIGVPRLTESRLLEEHLLGNWHLLGTGLQAAVLQHIVRQWQSGLAGSEPLKEKLAALAFVPDREQSRAACLGCLSASASMTDEALL